MLPRRSKIWRDFVTGRVFFLYTSYVDWTMRGYRSCAVEVRQMAVISVKQAVRRRWDEVNARLQMSCGYLRHLRITIENWLLLFLKFLAAVHQRSDDQHGVGDWRLCLKGHFCKNVANFAFLIFAQPRWLLPTSGIARSPPSLETGRFGMAAIS